VLTTNVVWGFEGVFLVQRLQNGDHLHRLKADGQLESVLKLESEWITNAAYHNNALLLMQTNRESNTLTQIKIQEGQQSRLVIQCSDSSSKYGDWNQDFSRYMLGSINFNIINLETAKVQEIKTASVDQYMIMNWGAAMSLDKSTLVTAGDDEFVYVRHFFYQNCVCRPTGALFFHSQTEQQRTFGSYLAF
jgi:hypothetical protein